VAAMIETILNEREEVEASRTPHLSYSRINRYLHCPEQYRLYYVENLRPQAPSASLVFGQILHQALAYFFQEKGDAVAFFQNAWGEAKHIELTYSKKETWEKLRDSGPALIGKFLQEELPKLQNVRASEKVFTLNITSLDLPFIGVIDLIADLDGKRTVVDFKTSGSTYEEHEVILSDQLTAYQLAEPQAEQAALCVLVKTKAPQIEWHLSKRNGDQLVEFLAKTNLVARDITAGRFYKRPGKWCAWCDYLPVC
jgi:ATP-dependent exoDNAse (exonuclease V) beta subunit